LQSPPGDIGDTVADVDFGLDDEQRAWLAEVQHQHHAVALSPKRFEVLASQPDLSPKAWPRYVRINAALPQTATNKILKRTLIAEGVSARDGVLWEREPRVRGYDVGRG
jgi:hypothetical protein